MAVKESDYDPPDELMQGNALIRANFGIDPVLLDEEQWAKRFCEAVWLESERLKNFATLMAKMWGNNG